MHLHETQNSAVILKCSFRIAGAGRNSIMHEGHIRQKGNLAFRSVTAIDRVHSFDSINLCLLIVAEQRVAGIFANPIFSHNGRLARVGHILLQCSQVRSQSIQEICQCRLSICVDIFLNIINSISCLTFPDVFPEGKIIVNVHMLSTVNLSLLWLNDRRLSNRLFLRLSTQSDYCYIVIITDNVHKVFFYRAVLFACGIANVILLGCILERFCVSVLLVYA